MLKVRKWKKGWIELDTRDNDVVHIKCKEVVWLVNKIRTNKTWVVVSGSNETYWEVDSTPEEIYNCMT